MMTENNVGGSCKQQQHDDSPPHKMQDIGGASWKRSSDIFQIVPLNDPPHKIPVIEPINPYKKPGTSSTSNGSAATTTTRGNAKLAPPFKFAGFLGTIASAFLFSVGVFCVKLLPVENTLQEKTKIVMIRGISLMTLCGITILFQGSTFLIKRDEILVNLIRSFVGFFGSFGIYVAVQFITVAEAVALTYTSPVWTCLLGYIILGERLPVTLTVGFPLGALGLILIAHPDLILNVQDEVISEVHRHHHHIVPPPNYTIHHGLLNCTTAGAANLMALNGTIIEGLELELPPEEATELYLEHRWPGVLTAAATSIIIAIVHITLKFRKTTPIQTTTFYLGVATFIMSLIIQLSIGFGKWPATWLEWFLHASIGMCSFVGQALFQWSLLYETAGTLSVVRSVDIVFSFIWSAVFLEEDVLWTSVVGALMIGLVVALIMFNDNIQRSFSKMCCKQ